MYRRGGPPGGRSGPGFAAACGSVSGADNAGVISPVMHSAPANMVAMPSASSRTAARHPPCTRPGAPSKAAPNSTLPWTSCPSMSAASSAGGATTLARPTIGPRSRKSAMPGTSTPMGDRSSPTGCAERWRAKLPVIAAICASAASSSSAPAAVTIELVAQSAQRESQAAPGRAGGSLAHPSP